VFQGLKLLLAFCETFNRFPTALKVPHTVTGSQTALISLMVEALNAFAS
jgi:hypothetical protein